MQTGHGGNHLEAPAKYDPYVIMTSSEYLSYPSQRVGSGNLDVLELEQ